MDTPNCVLLLRSGDEVIHDRIAFAGTNYKPLMMLRDAWASEASVWLSSYGQLKRAYDREVEAVQAAEARAAALGRRGEGGGEQPPAKRMRVRSAQVYKQKHPGSLTVNPGDMCIFIESCVLPLWSRVKMESDGRIGIISASKLEDFVEVPEPEMLPPSDDDEMQPPSDDEDAAANAYAARMAVDDEAAREVDDAAFVERAHTAEAAAEEAAALPKKTSNSLTYCLHRS